MTAAVGAPLIIRSAAAGPYGSTRRQFWGNWETWRDRLFRWKIVETFILVWIATLLFHDRSVIAEQFLFKYTDEDQAIMWLAAHDALEGKFHEPCFFGQDYNSCLEGFVAAPMIAMGVEYNMAVPSATVILALLPFVALALAAWWRGHTIVSAVSLLVPILMPVRYSMITGIPRGFVTGLGVAILPTILLLPPRLRPRRITADADEPRLLSGSPRGLHRSWPAIRYFLAAVLAVVALQVNQSCALLLVPVAVYAVLTSFREWKFWVFGIAGLLAALPYPIYVYQFYHRYHDDYRVYLRGSQFDDDRPLSAHFSSVNFTRFYDYYIAPKTSSPYASSILADLVPIHVSALNSPFFLACAFTGVLILLALRGRIAAVTAAFCGGLFFFVSMGYDRLGDVRGNNSTSFPHARLLLAIPVVFVWLLFLVNATPWRRFANTPPARWLACGILAGLLAAGMAAVKEKAAATPGVVLSELQRAQICQPIPTDEIYATAYEVQRAADANKANIVIVSAGGNDKTWAYILPALTTCDSLFASYTERRTWRFIEENQAGRHANILFLENGVGQRVGGGPVTVDADGYVVEKPDTAPPAPAIPPAGAGRGNGLQPGGRGGLGVLGGLGLGGRGGGGGGRGGRGRGATTFGGTTPDRLNQLPATHVVITPQITVLPTNGSSVMAVLRRLGFNLPVVYTPAKSAGVPDPQLTVTRQPWGR